MGADLFGHARPQLARLNSTRDKKENVAQLWRIHASKKDEQLQSAQAGDIVGVIGLRDSITGDTLCDTREPILLASIEFPETVISMAIEAESTEDRKKLAETLDMLRKQDPTFRAAENPETGQTLISGMGELHLEVDSAPLAPRLSPQRESSQTARQLPRDDR